MGRVFAHDALYPRFHYNVASLEGTMKRFFSCWALFAFAVSASADGPADRKATDAKSISSQTKSNARRVAIEDLYYTTRIISPSWSPDGKQIAYSGNASGRFNIWKMNADGSGAQQLTKSEERQSSPIWSPDGKFIIFQQDKGGDEQYDLYALSAAGGTPQNLTNTPDNREDNAQFAHNGRWLAFNSKPKSAPQFNVAVMGWKTRRVRQLTHEQTRDHDWQALCWSPDDKYIYAGRSNPDGQDISIYRIDVASGQAENLTPHSGNQQNTPSMISSDGKTMLMTSNEKGGYPNVALLDIATKQKRFVTDTQWEAQAGDWSPHGNRFSYAINADGRTSIYFAQRGDTPTRVAMPTGINQETGTPHAFSPDGTKLLVGHQDSTRPFDLWIVPLNGGQPTQLTHSARPSLNDTPLPQSQVVVYNTFDGKLISAYLWVPFNLTRNNSNPAIIFPHGGPTGQTVDSFNSIAVALASRGYIVLAPNVRGSTGYGLAFQKANYQDLGGGDLKDEVAGVEWLKQTGYVDPKKIGITGGSYGGFMTLMAIGKEPDIWAAAVELFGIIDWKTMLQHSDPGLQEYEKGLLGDPAKDVGAYEAASPIKYIRNEKAPLLILQGERDIRVPAEEARQVEQILKQEGKTVDAHYYPDEGHGWTKREDNIDSLTRLIAWFDKYLKGNSKPGDQ
jgi:dipeptidyl aminopeptidase/acylaminoacyl peptidase